MVRKKKTEKKNQGGTDDSGQVSVAFGLANDTKRSIAAIVCFSCAIVFILAFFSQAGVVGEFLDKHVSGAVFGWGKWIFPLFLLFAGYLFLRKSAKFHVMSFFGLIVFFFGILGILHMLFFDPVDFFEAASHASGGGFVGYILAFLLEKYIGLIAGFVVLFSLCVIGALVAFDISLLPCIVFVKNIRGLFHKKGEPGSEMHDASLSSENDEFSELSESPERKENFPEEYRSIEVSDVVGEHLSENIKNIRFDDDKKNISSEIRGQNGSAPDNFSQNQNTEIEQEQLAQESFFSSLKNSLHSEESTARDPWVLPSIDILEKGKSKANPGNVRERKRLIQETLAEFGIAVEPAEEKIGPTVTQYTFRPSPGVRLEKILSLHNNLAMALSAHPIRIEAPIPGTPFVGIEVPNESHEHVNMRDAVQNLFSKDRESKLFVTIGKKMNGEFEHRDIAVMPHLLVAGSTGTGKSVCVNSLLAALLFSNTPDELQLILVDPKKVELSFYEDIPHLAASVITENKKVVGVLKWAVRKMEERYEIMKEENVRSIVDYNRKMQKKKNEDSSVSMPSIVIVIDELADLMSSHGKEVEGAIVRLAQMARAVGIHLIVSTQRPDVKVLTGLIKANITNRIALKVATQIDSRTILDKSGAEKLLGRGDMLYMNATSPSLVRMQGVYVSDKEIRLIVKFWKEQADRRGNIPGGANDLSEQAEDSSQEIGNFSFANVHNDIPESKRVSEIDFETFAEEGTNDHREQELYNRAKEYVIQKEQASTSAVQRAMRIGYNHAARIVDELEKNGVVGPQNGSKPREILPPYAKPVEPGLNTEDKITM